VNLRHYLSLQGNSKTTGKTKSRISQEILASNTSKKTVNVALSLSQINIKLYSKVVFKFLHPVHCLSCNRNLQSTLKDKKYNLKRQRKHQNEIQIWQTC
jgi:hypothetical protein